MRKSGTACLCMLEPISARFASSCSRKGIREAATLTSCVGETSMYSMSEGSTIVNSPPTLAETRSRMKRPCSSRGAFACAILCCSSSRADR